MPLPWLRLRSSPQCVALHMADDTRRISVRKRRNPFSVFAKFSHLLNVIYLTLCAVLAHRDSGEECRADPPVSIIYE